MIVNVKCDDEFDVPWDIVANQAYAAQYNLGAATSK